MVEAQVLQNPVYLKARELAEALLNSPEFKEKNEQEISSLITLCNAIISNDTNLNYGAIGATQGSCCG